MNDYVGYKIKLLPNQEQIQTFNQYFGTCRFIYNLSIDLQTEYYLDDGNNYKFMTFYNLNNKVNALKNNNDDYKWLRDYDSTTIKLVLKDSINAYLKFFNHTAKHPRFKSRKRSNKQFPIRPERMTIRDNYVIISSIGKIKCSYHHKPEIIGDSNASKHNINYLKYTNPRISFDGLCYYLSFSLPKDDIHNINSYKRYGGNPEYIKMESSKSIGIDLGCKRKNWIVDSAGHRITLPDFSKENRKINHLNKKFQRQLLVNNNRKPRLYKNRQLPNGRTKNELKTIEKLNKYYKKISRRRSNEIHKYCKTLLELKPKSVVLEDLKVNDMIIDNSSKETNKQKSNVNRTILQSALHTVKCIISNTLEANNIPVILAPVNYPSTQLCSNCGYRQDIGRKRIYRCPKCGNIIDRDYNASLNLAKLGL